MIQTTVDAPAEWWPGMMADVAAAVGRRATAGRDHGPGRGRTDRNQQPGP